MSGFLENLWDETLAGPTPDLGQSPTRKLQPRGSIPAVRSKPDGVTVSRSITLLRTRSLPIGPGSDPNSPRLPGRRREDTGKVKMDRVEDADPRSPTVFDWIMISALDR